MEEVFKMMDDMIDEIGKQQAQDRIEADRQAKALEYLLWKRFPDGKASIKGTRELFSKFLDKEQTERAIAGLTILTR